MEDLIVLLIGIFSNIVFAVLRIIFTDFKDMSNGELKESYYYLLYANSLVYSSFILIVFFRPEYSVYINTFLTFYLIFGLTSVVNSKILNKDYLLRACSVIHSYKLITVIFKIKQPLPKGRRFLGTQ